MRKTYWRTSLVLLAALTLSGEAGTASALAAVEGENTRRSSFGVISGTVLDSRGNPVAGALVKVLRDGLNEVVRETKSAADGSFSARVTPGRYLLRALAEGFTPATFSSVQISSSTELVYRFNLQPVGEGRTTPERRADRNDPKFRIRASQTRRSVFHAGEGDEAVVLGEAAAGDAESADADGDAETSDGAVGVGGEVAEQQEEHRAGRTRMQGFVETYYASSSGPGEGGSGGVNFALAAPVSRRFDIIFSGQLGEFERLEATARLRAGARHRLSATVGGALIPLTQKTAKMLGGDKLGQFSVRAVDEWVVRDGIVLVLGLDYSRFTGAGGGADSLSPRLGAAFDAGARTRLHASFAPGTDSAARVSGVEMLEGGPVLFKEGARQAVALVDGQAVLERSYRLEFGVERVLDGASSVEATAFFDTVDGRGVGLLSTPANALSDAGNTGALLNIANQQGGARGLRVVYMRRISQHLKASAGYAFGRGQALSPEGITTPEQLFHSDFFQTVSAQLDASVGDGTTVRTVLRFSPRAAVFAIDPFDGRLAVYDPSLSILVTHELPNFGLPVRAQATLDARNLLDTLIGVEDGESILSLGALRRTVRGGVAGSRAVPGARALSPSGRSTVGERVTGSGV
ncbi:MAG: carboxypeptidase-like regulatory domain-containing protein [Acidobacteria bacterium]|nr:carboxypeptidase-like regulatory domain-containing protein [Acidobacteriota bacterium]